MKNEKSLKDTIYNAILEDIFSLEYKPGDILNEKALVEKYECSKSPVREALLELCKDNVLRNIPRYGYEVVKITMDDVREMIEFRYLLEAGILRKQYSELTEVHFSILEDIDKQCKKKENTMWDHWSLNTEFHLKLIGFGRNNFAMEELKRCMDRLKRAYTRFCWEQYEPELELDTRNHAMIIQALRERDIEKAVQYLARDLNDFGGKNYRFIEEKNM